MSEKKEKRRFFYFQALSTHTHIRLEEKKKKWWIFVAPSAERDQDKKNYLFNSTAILLKKLSLISLPWEKTQLSALSAKCVKILTLRIREERIEEEKRQRE